jgi:apolipoprotein N-acyltransferase
MQAVTAELSGYAGNFRCVLEGKIKNRLFRFIALILGIASAALATASLEVDSAGWLGWIALVPALIPLLLFKDRYGPAGLAGLGFGAGLGGGLFQWLLVDGRWVEWVTNVLSFIVLGLVWSWLVWRYARLPAPVDRTTSQLKKLQPLLPSRVDAAAAWAGSVAHLRIAMLTAAGWTVLEWARGLLIPAWNPLGLAIAGNLPLLQLVKATGPAGLSTMVVFANVIVLTSVRRLLREPGRMSWTGRFDVTATLAAIFLCAVAGFYSLAHPAENLLRRKVFCASAKNADVATLATLSKAAGAPGFDLLVWREATFNPADYGKLSELGIGKTAALFSGVAGTPGRGLIGSRTVLPGAVTNLFAPLNNAAFFVPFSSTVPNRNLTSFNHRDVSWLPFLNWQAGTPPLLRATLPAQAQVWIVLFDVPGRSRWAGRQLRENLKLWATAYGRALIFSGRGAGSLLESPAGRVMTQTREEPATAVTADLEIPAFGAETLYARLGDWWPVAMGMVALVFALSERLQRIYGGPRRFNS